MPAISAGDRDEDQAPLLQHPDRDFDADLLTITPSQIWRHFLPDGRRRENLDRIAGVLRAYDIVGLQEVDGGSPGADFVNQTGYLADRGLFPHWHDLENRRIGKIARHSLGLLSRLPLREVQEHRLPGAIPGRGSSRR